MNLKRRLSSFSRSRIATAAGEKEGTLPQYHPHSMHLHEQGSSIPDTSKSLDEGGRSKTRRGRGTSPVRAHGGPTARRLRAISPPSSGTHAPPQPEMQNDVAVTRNSDAQEVSSLDRSNVASASPHTDATAQKHTGIPKPRSGIKHWQRGSGDSPAMANGFHRKSVDAHHQRLGNRESGGLLRLEGSKGWTAPKWQGGGERPQADDQNKAENQRGHAFAPRTTPATSAPQIQVGIRYQESSVITNEKVGASQGGSSQFTDVEVHPPPSEQQRESPGQRVNPRTESGDQQDLQQGTLHSKSNSGGTPSEQAMRPVQLGPEEGVAYNEETRESSTEGKDDPGTGPTPANANQEWIQLELDRLKTEFQFKNQIASMLRTTLADLKTQRGAGTYPQAGPPGGSPHGGIPVPSMHSGVPVPNGGMVQGNVGQGGGVGPAGMPVMGMGIPHSGIPGPSSGVTQTGLQAPGGSPHLGIPQPGAGLSQHALPGLGSGVPNVGMPVPQVGVGHVGVQPAWQGSGFTPGYSTTPPGGDMVSRDGAHALLSPSTSARELALTKVELEKKSKHIGQLLAEISTLEAQVKVLSEALEEERRENSDLGQENAILRGQVERLTSASEKLLRGMTAIRV